MRARFNAAELAAVVAKTLSSIDGRTTSVLVEGSMAKCHEGRAAFTGAPSRSIAGAGSAD